MNDRPPLWGMDHHDAWQRAECTKMRHCLSFIWHLLRLTLHHTTGYFRCKLFTPGLIDYWRHRQSTYYFYSWLGRRFMPWPSSLADGWFALYLIAAMPLFGAASHWLNSVYKADFRFIVLSWNLTGKCNAPTIHPDTNLKNRFNPINTHNFYRVDDVIPLKKRILSISVAGLALREGRRLLLPA